MAAPVEPLSAFPLYQPLPRPYRGPIADAHMHARDAAAMENYWTVARLYGIHYACPIVELPVALELQQRYGDHVRPIVWGIRPRQENFQDLGAFRRKKEALLEAIAQHGWRWVKLWFTPRFLYWHRVWLDDPHLDFFFERMARLHLNLLVHVADPDVWFVREHGDRAREVKRQHYLQLERRLQAFPHMVFQLAHFAGYPEDLDFLDRLLERYPQVVLDSSATKWVAREFSRHGERARRFMVRWQERIVFGTDLVAHPEREKEGPRDHYATRFYVHQRLWEQAGVFDSPIEDADSLEPPRFYGLALPEDVLRRFYWDNAARLYALPVPHVGSTLGGTVGGQ